MREAVALPTFVGNLKTILLPCLIEQRNHAVVEKIEESLESMVFLADSLAQQLRVIKRQHTHGTGEPHEVHYHKRGRAIAPLQFLNAAGRKCERRVYAKPHHFPGGRPKGTYRSAIGTQSLQQSDSLEEIEGPDVIAQLTLQPVELTGRNR